MNDAQAYLKILEHYKRRIDKQIERVRAHPETELESEGENIYPMYLEYEIAYILYEFRKTRQSLAEADWCKCPLLNGEGDKDRSRQFMVVPGNATKGYKEIRDFTKDVNKLTVLDPYFFSYDNKGGDVHVYVNYLKSSLRLEDGLKEMHIIYSPRGSSNETVKREIVNACKSNGCAYTEKRVEDIHDRIWIADRERAVVVGTSFNGIGNRLSFILELPDADLNYLLEFLDEKGYSRKPV